MGRTDTGGERVRRADARRNIAAILDAAVSCLQRDPAVSLADIAAEAGVGRITLYGHFRSRAELVEAVLEEAMLRADAVLDDVEVSGDPAEALALLVSTSWRVVEQFRCILQAAQRELSAERIREAHERVVKRLLGLVERGRADGSFREDLPAEWLVTVVLQLIHAAADEVAAGRLDGDDAGWYVVATVLAAYTPTGRPIDRVVPASPSAAHPGAGAPGETRDDPGDGDNDPAGQDVADPVVRRH